MASGVAGEEQPGQPGWIFPRHPLNDLAEPMNHREAAMAVQSKAKAEWKGSLKEGGGEVEFGDLSGDYTFASRFETGRGPTRKS